VSDGEPPLGGLPEVGANLFQGLALGVTTGKCWDGGGVAARVGFCADNRGEGNRDIDDNGWGWG
jgi:hypothetical protein